MAVQNYPGRSSSRGCDNRRHQAVETALAHGAVFTKAFAESYVTALQRLFDDAARSAERIEVGHVSHAALEGCNGPALLSSCALNRQPACTRLRRPPLHELVVVADRRVAGVLPRQAITWIAHRLLLPPEPAEQASIVSTVWLRRLLRVVMRTHGGNTSILNRAGFPGGSRP
jgi:hypothetical protein